MVMIG